MLRCRCRLWVDFVAEVGDDRLLRLTRTSSVSHLLSAPQQIVWHHCRRRTLHSLCKARLGDWRWSDDELCEPTEVLRDCRQCELELGTAWPTQPQTTEPKDALEMCKQHLDTFAIAARSLECFGLGQRPRRVTSLLVDTSRDSAEGGLWAALRLEYAAAAIACPGPVIQCLPIGGHLASRGENLAGRTNVNVTLLVECEVFPTERSVFSLRFVDHRDVRRYLCLVDQPVEVGSGTVGGVAREPFGLDGEALLGAFDHGLGRANFGLADGARRLDVHDDAGLHVNQIIVGIGKERRSAALRHQARTA